MNTLPIVFLCMRLLLAVQAASDCPEECRCEKAEFGGIVAHCSSLNVKQNFSNNVHHLNVTNASPEKPFVLESKIFNKLHLDALQSIKIVNSSLLLIAADAFHGMNMLNFVDLSDNQLASIHPDTFKDNSNLRELSLSGNPLELAPLYQPQENYFLKSHQITDLNLSRCQLRNINSSAFSQLPNLENLNLDSNNIHFLNKNVFESLEFLEEIDLSNNQLTDLNADVFAAFEDLTTLKLSNNSISNFDDVDIPSLKELDLSYNAFRSLESTTLEGVPDISQVTFSHNIIEVIDEDTFTDLNRLRYVDLSYNNLKGPLSQFLFETNTELETLSFAYNKDLLIFNGFTGKLNYLYKLELSYCGLVGLSEEAFSNIQHLSTLDLSGNELTELLPKTFTKLARLNNLDLSNNLLTTLSEDLFSGNMDLRKLKISGNKIHHLPARLFEPVPHLTWLDVSRCRFSYLWNMNESAFMKENKILNQLTFLNLEGNKFQTLHQHNFESLENLKTLDIAKNPFQCDQFFVLLMQWLVETKVTPVKYLGKSSSDMQEEHAELHWNHMLSKVCSEHTNIIVKDSDPIDQGIDKDLQREGLFNDEEDTAIFNNRNYHKKIFGGQEYNMSDNFSFADLIAQNVRISPEEGGEEDDTQYPWVWPVVLVVICAISILLAIFNLSALILYRTGRNYRSAGYRSTFITPLGSHKIKRDAGSFYHKLYEECSVPNSVPIITGSDDLKKSAKKSTIIISGASKGEDMV